LALAHPNVRFISQEADFDADAIVSFRLMRPGQVPGIASRERGGTSRLLRKRIGILSLGEIRARRLRRSALFAALTKPYVERLSGG